MNVSHLTLDELTQISNFNACAIYQIKPSLSYVISTYYKDIDISQQGPKISVKGELQKEIFDHFHNQCNLTKSDYEIIFSFENEIRLKHRYNFVKDIHSLPKLKNNKLHFESHGLDLDFEIALLKQYIKRVFTDNPFTISYNTKYNFDSVKFYKLDLKVDDELFWKKMYSEIHGEIFKISTKFKTVSFDFKNENDFNLKLKVIESIPEIEIYNRRDNHKFKIYDFGIAV